AAVAPGRSTPPRPVAGGDKLHAPPAPAPGQGKGAGGGPPPLRRAAAPPRGGLTEVPARSCSAFRRCAAVSGSAAPARRRRRQPQPRLDQELVAARCLAAA